MKNYLENGAYNKIKAVAKQRRIVRLLREIKKVSLRNTSSEMLEYLCIKTGN